MNHFRSQKFAGFVFAVFVLFASGLAMSHEAFSTLSLALAGLYTAFVGGRAYSDAQALKSAAPPTNTTTTVKAKLKAKDEEEGS